MLEWEQCACRAQWTDTYAHAPSMWQHMPYGLATEGAAALEAFNSPRLACVTPATVLSPSLESTCQLGLGNTVLWYGGQQKFVI